VSRLSTTQAVGWIAACVLLCLSCSDIIKVGEGWSDVTELEGGTHDVELSPLNNGKSIAVDQSGRVHMTYRMRRKQGDDWSGWEVAYKRLSPVEGGFDPDHQSVVVNESVTHGQPCIATSGTDMVLVAWYQDVGGVAYIFTTASNDGGLTWPGPIVSWTPTSGGSRPAAAFDSQGRLHLVWRTRECTKYLRSNEALNGCEIEKLIHSTYLVTTRQPSIAVDDSDCVHVGWSYAGFTSGYGVDYARSTDCGDSWTSTGIAGTGDDPPVTIVADHHGRIYEFWSGVRYRRSLDRGITWDGEMSLATGSMAAAAIGPNDHIHVVYVKDGAIWYIASDNYGTSWTMPWRVTDADANSAEAPDVAVGADGFIHVVWQQYDADNKVHQLCYRVGQ